MSWVVGGEVERPLGVNLQPRLFIFAATVEPSSSGPVGGQVGRVIYSCQVVIKPGHLGVPGLCVELAEAAPPSTRGTLRKVSVDLTALEGSYFYFLMEWKLFLLLNVWRVG